jgi:hypothetical protein
MPQVPQTPTDFDKPAETDEEIFLECANRLRIAEEAESTNRLLAIEDLEFADGQQWPDDLYNMRKVQRRPALTINHTGTLVRRVVNNMKEQRPRIKVHPVGDGVQIEDARVANGLIRHIETRSTASVAYDLGGESAVRIGWGYARILGEYIDEMSFEQELCIKPVRNTLTGYIDPAAQMPDGSDMEWFIFSDSMSRQEFKRRYPNEDLADWKMGAAGDSHRYWLTKTRIRIAEYYRIKKTKDTLLKLTGGRTILKSDYRKHEEAFTLAGLGIVQERPTERRQVQWFRVNGVTVVDRRDLPGRYIPVVRFEGNVLDLNGDVRRKGMIRDLKDPARMFNYWETAKTEKLALSSKAPWIAAEGQVDGHPEWDDANQKPYSMLKYKIVIGPDGVTPLNIPPPQRQPAVEVEAGFAEASQSAGRNLMMVAGMPHEPGQDTPGTVVSGVALRRRQALSDVSHLQYYDNQTLAIAQVGRILLDLFPHYYSEERMQRIIGDDGVPEMVKLNQKTESQGIIQIKNNMGVGRYDVVMDTGPGYETKRIEAAENFLDLLKTPMGEPVVKVASDVVMRNFDFPGAQDVADRLMPATPEGMKKAMEGLPKQAQSIVQAMQQQLTQAQQTIQQLQLEIKYKMNVEGLKQEGETKRTLMESHTKVHDTDTRAATALQEAHIREQGGLARTEIQAAGQLLNTHAEATHDRAAAKELLKAGERAEKSNGAK